MTTKTETVALGIPVNEISVKYLRKYVDKAWIISEDSDEIMDKMLPGYSIIPLSSVDEPGSSYKDGKLDIAAYLNVPEEQLMILPGTHNDRYNYDGFRQIVLFNIPRYKITPDSLVELFKRVVEGVGSGQQEVMFTGSIYRVMNIIIKDGGEGYGLDNYVIKRLSNNSGLINNIYLRQLNSTFVVARTDAAAGKKTKTTWKRQFSKLKRDCSMYAYNKTFEIIQDYLAAAIEESIAHYYAKQTPKSITAHINCNIHHSYTLGKALGLHKKITGEDFLTAVKGALRFKNKRRWDSAYATPFSRELKPTYRGLVSAILYLVNLDRHGLHPVDCFEDTNRHMQANYRQLKPAWPILQYLWEFLYIHVDKLCFNDRGFSENKGKDLISVSYLYSEIRKCIIDEYRPGCLLHGPEADGEDGYINEFIRDAGERFIPYRNPKKKGKK